MGGAAVELLGQRGQVGQKACFCAVLLYDSRHLNFQELWEIPSCFQYPNNFNLTCDLVYCAGINPELKISSSALTFELLIMIPCFGVS